MSLKEMKNIISLLFKNIKTIKKDHGLLNLQTLSIIRSMIDGKFPNYRTFELNDNQKNLIIKAFLMKNNIFDEHTAPFIKGNSKCIKHAVNCDIKSLDYIAEIDKTIEKELIKKAIESKYILKEKSPKFLKENFDVAYSSIKKDVYSIDYSNILDKNKETELIDLAIDNGYILHAKSSPTLKANDKLVWKSIKQDIKNAVYMDLALFNDKEIFKYLYLHEYDFKSDEISQVYLSWLKNEKIIDLVFQKNEVFNKMPSIVNKKFKKILHDFVNTTPKVENFMSVFNVVADNEWNKYRSDNNFMFENIIGKICSLLQKRDDFNDAYKNMKFLDNMKKVLGDKYQFLIVAMKNYFEIYHKNLPDKISLLEEPRDIISNLSALYIAKSKENHKKETIESCLNLFKSWFKLKCNHPIIKVHTIQLKQKEKFKKLYDLNDVEVRRFLKELSDKYSEYISKREVDTMIYLFINKGYDNLSEFFDVPSRYNEFMNYKETHKLINRLNSGYIDFNGNEVPNHLRYLIGYNEYNHKYYYLGNDFNYEEKNSINDYLYKNKIFSEIKREIMQVIKTIEVSENEIDSKEYKKLVDRLPLTDEYFEFNLDMLLNQFSVDDFIDQCISNESYNEKVFKNDACFNLLYNILIKNAMLWILMDLPKAYISPAVILKRQNVNLGSVIKLINSIPKMIELAENINMNLNDYKDLRCLEIVSNSANKFDFCILGSEVVENLCTKKSHTNKDEKTIVKMATELVCGMRKKQLSTIPYVKGRTLNYKYSMYDSLDESILLSGIYTDSCFKIGGTDHDFMHYCTLNKNGFVIKITDLEDNFIARASGFRNGNSVYINQLRTINDAAGGCYCGIYTEEKKEIIETFREACKDIFNTSQNNIEEKDKIDFVFVTRSYSLYEFESNVSSELREFIGDNPMDITSKNWDKFVKHTPNLDESKDEGWFETDFGKYKIICMASVKTPSDIEETDVKSYDVPALYKRERNKIVISNKVDESIIKKVNKIKAISAYLLKKDFQVVKNLQNTIAFIGDNWFILFRNGNIIDSCLLDFDEEAKKEFSVVQNFIEYNKIKEELSSEVIETLNSEILKRTRKN